MYQMFFKYPQNSMGGNVQIQVKKNSDHDIFG